MSEVFFLIDYNTLDFESYAYILRETIGDLAEPDEITSPANEAERELAASGKELFKYEGENGTVYRIDTSSGDLLYAEERIIDEMFLDPDIWGKKYTKNPLTG